MATYTILAAAASALLFFMPPAIEAGHGIDTGMKTVRASSPFERAQLREKPRESLLQADAEEAHSSAVHSESSHLASLSPARKSVGPKGAGWFAAFSEGESNYDRNADDGRAHLDQNNVGKVLAGWNPQLHDPYDSKVKEAVWFDESKSAGSKEAWQTHYPALQTGLAGHGATPGNWYQDAAGYWQEEYQKPKKMKPENILQMMDPQAIPASWFDNAVSQYDGYGRPQSPNIGTGYSLWDWEERSVNTTLTCADPGCVANVSLQAPFDPSKEVARFCKLSVFFHATDFDEMYSGEKVEWIEVNNHRVSTDCFPQASGCNATAAKPLYPCVNSADMSMVMSETGYMSVAAKIPETVDECAVEGNLLSAVPMVTCLVTKKENAHDEKGLAAPRPLVLNQNIVCKTEAPIRCASRGCMAETVIPVAKVCAPTEKNKCKLSMSVFQTDYDSATTESISFIDVNGKEEKKDVKPGKNPCKAQWRGENVTDKDRIYDALKDVDVSKDAALGFVRVSAKISKFVDECAHDGYLFNGLVTVDCGHTMALDPEDSPGTGLAQVQASIAADANTVFTQQERSPRQLRVRRQ